MSGTSTGTATSARAHLYRLEETGDTARWKDFLEALRKACPKAIVTHTREAREEWLTVTVKPGVTESEMPALDRAVHRVARDKLGISLTHASVRDYCGNE